MRYLIDTYALIEWYEHGSEEYKPYLQEMQASGGYVTQLTLLELYYLVHSRFGMEKAEQVYEEVNDCFEAVGLDDELIKKTGEFKSYLLKSKKRMSYIDCVNYVAAKHLGVKLLTGDDDFKGMENVEFVK
ncbi:MAG: hypothetical protein MSIBF_01395 [Candidatus Altiarchaeales archaeon IMC4]|nr:MAG: hypothetical protein MSIBF_01395 [Candidatus Altiarchaeales archaeon IMC4]